MRLKVRLRFFALYREIVGKAWMQIEVDAETTPTQIWDELCQDFAKLTEHSNAWRVAVNGEYAERHASLNEGDEVAFIPPLSGG